MRSELVGEVGYEHQGSACNGPGKELGPHGPSSDRHDAVTPSGILTDLKVKGEGAAAPGKVELELQGQTEGGLRGSTDRGRRLKSIRD